MPLGIAVGCATWWDSAICQSGERRRNRNSSSSGLNYVVTTKGVPHRACQSIIHHFRLTPWKCRWQVGSRVLSRPLFAIQLPQLYIQWSTLPSPFTTLGVHLSSHTKDAIRVGNFFFDFFLFFFLQRSKIAFIWFKWDFFDWNQFFSFLFFSFFFPFQPHTPL